MSQRSKFDPSQIAQMTFDELSKSNKVKLVDTEISMELDHKDGDSITSHPAKLLASAVGCDLEDAGSDVIPALDCSSLREIRVDVEGSGSCVVLVSPIDQGDFFYEVGGPGQLHKICARRIKVLSQNVIGDVHLVGRS
jgi:hypothetical protein